MLKQQQEQELLIARLRNTSAWSVTTEGDVEGRSVRDLGAYQGSLVEVAKQAAGRALYGLRLSPAKPKDMLSATKTGVDISLDIMTGTWDMSHESRVAFFRRIVGDEVLVHPSRYYACVRLEFPEDNRARLLDEIAKQEAKLAELKAQL